MWIINGFIVHKYQLFSRVVFEVEAEDGERKPKFLAHCERAH